MTTTKPSPICSSEEMEQLHDETADIKPREFSEFGEFSQNRSSDPISLTVVSNDKGYATKVFSLDDAGSLTKRSAANIYEGFAQQVSVLDLEEFGTLIETLISNQAPVYGVSELSKALLLTQEALRSGVPANTIARDRDHFSFRRGKPGILMLDFDQREGRPPKDWKELDEILSQIIPGWSEVKRLWRASSSAYLYRSDGQELIGIGGLRCYVVADDASAIPQVGAHIYQKLWEEGHGYIVVSKSGQALDRSLVDASVWQPERVDFVAEPILEGDIVRKAPASVLLGQVPYLDTTTLKAEQTLNEFRRTSKAICEAKAAVSDQCKKVRAQYVDKQIAVLKKRNPKAKESRLRRQLERAVQSHKLSSDFVLHQANGSTVTVRELLADPEKYHQCRFADPLEPDYQDDKRIAYANLKPKAGRSPYIVSHAHGGQYYELVHDIPEIILRKGERPRVVDETLDVMKSCWELYERGGGLVRVTGDTLHTPTEPWLNDHLGRRIRFYVEKRTQDDIELVPADTPDWLCRQIIAKNGERGLRELEGIITAPTVRKDDTVLCTPGYDEATKLLLVGSGWPEFPKKLNRKTCRVAFKFLWKAFEQFPFETPEDRGVMVACLLTALVRRILPCAPAFSFDAPTAASGKTLLGKCVLTICGTPASAIPQCHGDEELRKRLLPVLRQGLPAVLFDNVKGQFASPALEALLTSERFSDRILGCSEFVTLPVALLVMFSGNNFQPKGDLFRRILTTRIDPKTEAPERRSFDLNPLEHCKKNRQGLVLAGLMLLRAFIEAGKPRSTPDRLASFEEWDDLIRQCVLWIANEGIADLGDPTACIEAAKEREPERQKLAAFLETTFAVMDDKTWRVADLIRESDSGSSKWPPNNFDSQSKSLHAALGEIASERGVINSRILGRWIDRHEGTRCCGLYLERLANRQNAAVWRIRRDEP